MEIRKILFRKEMKLVTLLLTSLLIASASAAVYNYMYMAASPISVETAQVVFVDGGDATCTLGTNDTYVLITDLAGWPNATRVYEDAVRIQNLGALASCDLLFDSWSGDTASVNYIYVKVFDTVGGTQQGSTLSITPAAQNSTGTFNLPATTTWYVQWEIRWDGDAYASHTVAVTLKLKVT